MLELVSDVNSAPLLSDNLLELYRKMSDVFRKLNTSFMPNYATNYADIAAMYSCALQILRQVIKRCPPFPVESLMKFVFLAV